MKCNKTRDVPLDILGEVDTGVVTIKITVL